MSQPDNTIDGEVDGLVAQYNARNSAILGSNYPPIRINQALSKSEQRFITAITNLIAQETNKAVKTAIPKFADMPKGNADFMEGFRAACIQMKEQADE